MLSASSCSRCVSRWGACLRAGKLVTRVPALISSHAWRDSLFALRCQREPRARAVRAIARGLCSPHSFLSSCSHHQRPARSGSPGRDRARAGRAADGREAAIVQRDCTGTSCSADEMRRRVARPVEQRIDLENAVRGIELGRRGVCARRADWPARRPGDPGRGAGERAAQRLDLAHRGSSDCARRDRVTEAVDALRARPGLRAPRRSGSIAADAPSVALFGLRPDVVGFRKQPAGVEGDDVDRRVLRRRSRG